MTIKFKLVFNEYILSTYFIGGTHMSTGPSLCSQGPNTAGERYAHY